MIHLAAEYGYINAIAVLVKAGAQIDLAGDTGRTAMMRAAANGNLEIVKYLCEHGAQIT